MATIKKITLMTREHKYKLPLFVDASIRVFLYPCSSFMFPQVIPVGGWMNGWNQKYYGLPGSIQIQFFCSNGLVYFFWQLFSIWSSTLLLFFCHSIIFNLVYRLQSRVKWRASFSFQLFNFFFAHSGSGLKNQKWLNCVIFWNTTHGWFWHVYFETFWSPLL